MNTKAMVLNKYLLNLVLFKQYSHLDDYVGVTAVA